MELNCSACFPLVLPSCTDSITLSLGLTPLDVIYWKLSSYKKSYLGQSIVLPDGSLVLNHIAFSEALFIPAEGVFVFTIESVNSEPTQPICDLIPLVVCETEYPCIGITFSEQQGYSAPPEPVCPPKFVVVKTTNLTPPVFGKAYFEAEFTGFTPGTLRWFYVNNSTNVLTFIPQTTPDITTGFGSVGVYTVICMAFGDDKEEYLFNSVTVEAI